MGVIENSLMSWRGQRENVSIEENSPSDPWLYGWKVPKTDQDIQFKPFKIWLSKSTIQGVVGFYAEQISMSAKSAGPIAWS